MGFFQDLKERFVNTGGTDSLSIEGSMEEIFKSASDQDIYKLVSKIKELGQKRDQKFNDYESMAEDSVIQSAIELMADDATQTDNNRGATIWTEPRVTEEDDISDKKENTVKELNDWLQDTVNIEKYIWTYAFNTVKYGELFLNTFYEDEEFEDADKELGEYFDMVTSPLDIIELTKYGETIGYYNAKEKAIYPPDSYIHFISDRAYNREEVELERTTDKGEKKKSKYIIKYGTSFLEAARSAYRVLDTMEDVLLLSRIVRSAMYRLMQVEVGSSGKKKTVKMINELKRAIESRESFNKMSDLYNSDKSPIPLNSNVYLPMRSGKGEVRMEEVGGHVDVKDIVDVEYFRNKLFAALKVPKSFMGWEECLRANTEIPLLNGETKTIKEIADNQDDYIGRYILSANEDGEIVPTEIVHAKKTRRDANFVRVHLDNGKYVDATPDHLFMLRNGEFKEAGDLEPEDSLMPLYQKQPEKGWYKDYKLIKDNQTSQWQPVHRYIASKVYGEDTIEDKLVHHKDKNKLNNEPINLEAIERADHIKEFHKEELDKWIQAGIESNKDMDYSFTQTDEFKQKISNALKGKSKPAGFGEKVPKALKGRAAINPFKAGEDNIMKKDEVKEKMLESRKEYFENGGKVWQEDASAEEVQEWQEKIQSARWDGKRKYYEYEVVCSYCGKKFKDKFTPEEYQELVSGRGNAYCCRKHQMKIRNQVRAEKLFYEIVDEYGYCNEGLYESERPKGYMKYENITEFIENKPKIEENNYNHKVVEVEELDITEDAYDLGVANESHTFPVNAGVFVHNSLPGSMGNTSLTKLDIRYARTVKRIQAVLEQGVKEMCNFYLKINDKKDMIGTFKVMTSEVTTAESADRVEELSNKVRLADSINSLLGRDFEEIIKKREFAVWLSDNVVDIEGLSDVIKTEEEMEKEAEEGDNEGEDSGGGGGGFNF